MYDTFYNISWNNNVYQGLFYTFIPIYLTKYVDTIPVCNNPALQNGDVANDHDIVSGIICVTNGTWVWLLTLFINLVCTFSVYPGLTVLIESVEYGKVYRKCFVS